MGWMNARDKFEGSLLGQLILGRAGKLALAVSAVAALTVSFAEQNDVAACRGAGVMTRGSDGTVTTTWSDGAYKKQLPDSNVQWSYPSGSEPVPDISPGHRPGPAPSGHSPN